MLTIRICREIATTRSEDGGEEENELGKGEKGLYLGQAIVYVPSHLPRHCL